MWIFYTPHPILRRTQFKTMAAYRHVNNITTLFIYLFIGIIIIIIDFL